MYSLSLIIILCVLVCNTKAQTPICYDTCSYLKKFEGNWQYVNGIDTIRITLRHARVFDEDDSCLIDKLYGWHEYKKGNIIVESIYQNRNMPILYHDTSTVNSWSIIGAGFEPVCNQSSLKTFASITDFSQNNEDHQVVIEINAALTQIVWKQRHREGFGFLTGATGMTLPREFVLIKQ